MLSPRGSWRAANTIEVARKKKMLRLTKCDTNKVVKGLRKCKGNIAMSRPEHERQWYTIEKDSVLLTMSERYIPVALQHVTVSFAMIYQLQGRSKLHDDVWPSGTFSDVLLVAEGKEFAVHRAILASASPYFWALFTRGTEASQSVIDLPEVTAEQLQWALDLIYRVPREIGGLKTIEMVLAAQRFGLDLPLERTLLRDLTSITAAEARRAVELLDMVYPIQLDGGVVDSILFESLTEQELREIVPVLPQRFQDVFNETYEPFK